MKIASAMAMSVSTVATCERRRDHGSRNADQATEVPSRTSEAASAPRHNANSAPVEAMRQGKPMLLTMRSESRLHRKTARQGASAAPPVDRFDKVSHAAASR